MSKLKIIGVFVVIIFILISFFSMRVNYYKTELHSTSTELNAARVDLYALHSDLSEIRLETYNFNQKSEVLEEIKNESYNNKKDEYRAFADTVLPNDTRLLLRKARESTRSKTN